MAVSRLAELREAVSTCDERLPEARRRRRLPKRASSDAWTAEAERVASNIRSLGLFLRSVRRAYLDLSSSLNASSSRSGLQNAPKSLELSTEGLAAWERVRWLTDRERDEIDFQAKGILRRCMDRIRELERVDRIRQQSVAAQRQPSLVRMLGIQDPAVAAAEAKSTQLTAHRTAVTLSLNHLLADVGKAQQLQQEARVKRQLERTSGGAASAGLGTLVGPNGAVGMSEFGEHLAGTRSDDRRAGKANGHARAPSMYTPDPSFAATLADEEDDDDLGGGPIESLLTPAQVQMFEAEASSLLRATQDQLESLRTAEASLLEISALQSELVVHLTQQSEMVDQLYDDAIVVTGRVESGNQQLKRAAERNRESRVFLLVFLIGACDRDRGELTVAGASLSLLFLDYYGR